MSPSGKWTIAFVFFLSIIRVVTISLERPFANCICSLFPLCMETNALQKSMKNSVASTFSLTPSMLVWICDVVEQFLPKPFWFFKEFSINLDWIWLRRRVLYTLATLAATVLPLLFLVIPKLLFLRKNPTFRRFFKWVLLLEYVVESEKYNVNFFLIVSSSSSVKLS